MLNSTYYYHLIILIRTSVRYNNIFVYFAINMNGKGGLRIVKRKFNTI